MSSSVSAQSLADAARRAEEERQQAPADTHSFTDRDLVAGVVQLANLLTRRLVPVFERSGVTPQQWAVLSVIGAAGGALIARPPDFT